MNVDICSKLDQEFQERELSRRICAIYQGPELHARLRYRDLYMNKSRSVLAWPDNTASQRPRWVVPQPGEGGMNRTPTWGRTYWGGALFCLTADIAIRKKTNNRKGLQDALRAIVAAGGTIEKEWPLSKLLQIGDDATGTTVLIDMYRQWKDSPVQINLTELWNELGVRSSGRSILFESGTSLAAIRKGITAPVSQSREALPTAIWVNHAAAQTTK